MLDETNGTHIDRVFDTVDILVKQGYSANIYYSVPVWQDHVYSGPAEGVDVAWASLDIASEWVEVNHIIINNGDIEIKMHGDKLLKLIESLTGGNIAHAEAIHMIEAAFEKQNKSEAKL